MVIENVEGELKYGHNEVQSIAIEHFNNLLGTPSQVDFNDIQRLTPINTVSLQDAATIEREVTNSEILSTLKSMKKNKSLGPDGFNVNFFLHSWDIMGRDFTLAVKSFFQQGCFLRGTNSTTIALVPKIANPSSMNDYRPISCCNTTYKCISKIIASRLKGCFPS